MHEIWRHTKSGEQYLVALHGAQVIAVAGPLFRSEDPRRVLALHNNQHHNALAMLDIHRHPENYRREYTTERDGRVLAVSDAE